MNESPILRDVRRDFERRVAEVEGNVKYAASTTAQRNPGRILQKEAELASIGLDKNLRNYDRLAGQIRENTLRILEESVGEYLPLSNETYPSKSFEVRTSAGSGLYQVELVVKYSGTKEKSILSNIFGALIFAREKKPKEVTLSASIISYGAEKDIPSLRIPICEEKGAQAHNIFEKRAARYLNYAIEEVALALDNKMKENGQSVEARLGNYFEGQLIHDVAMAMRNPLFVATYKNMLLQIAVEKTTERHGEQVKELGAGTQTRLKEINRGVADLEERLKAEYGKIPSTLQEEVEARTKAIRTASANELEKLAGYANAKKQELEAEILKSAGIERARLQNELEALNKEVQARKQFLRGRKRELSESQVYILNELRKLFPNCNLYNKYYNSDHNVTEVYRAEKAREITDTLSHNNCELTPEQMMKLVESVKVSTGEDRRDMVDKYSLGKILKTAEEIALKVGSKGLEQFLSLLQKAGTQSAKDILGILKTFNIEE